MNLSAGYKAEFEEKAGQYQGQPFSHIQKDIYINHIALVDNPRAGDDAKIFDSKGKGMGFNFFRKNVSVIDEEAAQSIQDAFEEIREQVTTLKQEVQSLRDSQHVSYEVNDSAEVDVERIVQAVKKRIEKKQMGVQSMIRDEIQKAFKEI